MGHANSRLTPFERKLLVDRVRVWGWSVAAAAEAAVVSRQTAYKWLRRFEAEGVAGLRDRSSRPHRSPGRIPTQVEDRVVADRVAYREGPHLMAGRLDVPRSTIYAVLCRRGRKGKAFADALAQLGAAHKLTRPYRPQTNGKVERFNQTLAHGWAYKTLYITNTARRLALTDFLNHYNHRRPHSALGDQPPITRVVNHLCGNDS